MDPQEHDMHMEQMKAGLQQILMSEDLNEIKSIAQGLLGAEQSEQQTEAPMGSKESLDEGVDKILAK